MTDVGWRHRRAFAATGALQAGSAQHLGGDDNDDCTPDLRFRDYPQKQNQPEPTMCGFRLYWPQGRVHMP